MSRLAKPLFTNGIELLSQDVWWGSREQTHVNWQMQCLEYYSHLINNHYSPWQPSIPATPSLAPTSLHYFPQYFLWGKYIFWFLGGGQDIAVFLLPGCPCVLVSSGYGNKMPHTGLLKTNLRGQKSEIKQGHALSESSGEESSLPPFSFSWFPAILCILCPVASSLCFCLWLRMAINPLAINPVPMAINPVFVLLYVFSFSYEDRSHWIWLIPIQNELISTQSNCISKDLISKSWPIMRF